MGEEEEEEEETKQTTKRTGVGKCTPQYDENRETIIPERFRQNVFFRCKKIDTQQKKK